MPRHGTTTQRGYGSTHQRTAALLKPHAIGTACPLCGLVMQAGDALDLDHTTQAITHATCNRRAGGNLVEGGWRRR